MPKKGVQDLERKTQRATEALQALLDPSGIPKRGTVLADLLYRAEHASVPDGFPRSSAPAGTLLARPTSQQGLRTNPEDALRRKREHGFAEGSSVENAVESLMEDVCEDCKGTGRKLYTAEELAAPAPVGMKMVSGISTQHCKPCGGTGRKFHDPISEAVDELRDALERVIVLSHTIDKKRQIVLHARDVAPSETSAENCRCCHRKVYGGRSDPIRRGLCAACAQAYYLWRVDNGTDDESSDRQRFSAERGPERRHEGHAETTCDQCAEDRRKAGDDWRLDRADDMRRRAS